MDSLKQIPQWNTQRYGELSEYARSWVAALAQDPNNAEAANMLGVCLSFMGMLGLAGQHFGYALALTDAPSADIFDKYLTVRRLSRELGTPDSIATRLARESEARGLALACQEIISAKSVAVCEPQVRPAREGTIADRPSGSVKLPPTLAFRLSHAIVDPDSSLPITRDVALAPDRADLKRHVLVEEFLRVVRLVEADKVEVALRTEALRGSEMGTAVVLTSFYWNNWAHFLTELLPKALLADAVPEWRDFPFLISAHRLLNAEALLRQLLSPQRQIVRAAGRINVRDAAFVSAPTFAPYEYRYDWTREKPSISVSDCLFIPEALDLVRRTATARLRPDDHGTERIFLKRNSTVRRLVNADELERLAQARGYRVVAPETLPAQEQVRLFAYARVIAGPTGAALANMIFAPPGCRILGMYAFSEHANFEYFPNMADALGHEFHWLLGQPVRSGSHPAHFDFRVDVRRLQEALDAIET